MDERDWLAQRFQEHRPRLRAVAYRMLGSTSEADDAVQEAWLRLSRSNASEIDNLEAWLVTVVGRVALNMLRSRKTRREEPIDAQYLPEPIVDRAEGIDPEHEALLADSVGLALLVVLETLTPAERLAYVLHDMFSVPFEETAAPRTSPAERCPPRRETASSCGPRLSTARPAGSQCSTENSTRSAPSTCTTGGSREWTSSSTPHASPASILQTSTPDYDGTRIDKIARAECGALLEPIGRKRKKRRVLEPEGPQD